jgi:hypothetical protein
MSGAPLPLLVPVPYWVLLCIWGPHPTHWEEESPSGSSCPLVGSSPKGLGGCTPVTREVITHCPQSWTTSPQEMLQEAVSQDRRHWGSLTGSNIYCYSTGPADLCLKPERQEQRGLSLYTLASRLQKQKARSNPYMVIFNPVGYFYPNVMWIFFPVLCDLHVQIPQVLSLCYAFLLLYQDSGLVCFSFDPPLCYKNTLSSFIVSIFSKFSCTMFLTASYLIFNF